MANIDQCEATYSPDDNKLRLRAVQHLDDETYQRVKAAGFKWAPRQELFVAPMWTPDREDLLSELCGEIGDEDTSLIDRAEDRAERFEGYSENRLADATAAQASVAAIADGIPMGQPILVGHHSERHARKDAKRIESGMRRAVKMWRTSEYWTTRAAGAIRRAKYVETAPVRARRIKRIEAEKRKQERRRDESAKYLKVWQAESLNHEMAVRLANFDYISREFPLADYPRNPPASQYEGTTSLWSAMTDGVITWEQARDIAVPTHERIIAHCARWIEHYGNRLAYERAMLGDQGGTVADRTKPEKGGGVRCWASPRGGWSYVVRVNKVTVSVLDNWGNGGDNFRRTIEFDKLTAIMPAADVDEKRAAGLLVETEDETGFYLRSDPPQLAPKAKVTTEQAAAFGDLESRLREGVEVVTAPQLFPTPPDLAARMVEAADIQHGQNVLEPSAGTGNILEAIGPGPNKTAVEINQVLAHALLRQGHSGLKVVVDDFLLLNGELGTFDRVLMNPPFENGQDIKHIEHARQFLKPGGRLVAICAGGPRQEARLKPLALDSGGTWEPLPAGTFKDSGTGVNSVLLTIEG